MICSASSEVSPLCSVSWVLVRTLSWTIALVSAGLVSSV